MNGLVSHLCSSGMNSEGAPQYFGMSQEETCDLQATVYVYSLSVDLGDATMGCQSWSPEALWTGSWFFFCSRLPSYEGCMQC